MTLPTVWRDVSRNRRNDRRYLTSGGLAIRRIPQHRTMGKGLGIMTFDPRNYWHGGDHA